MLAMLVSWEKFIPGIVEMTSAENLEETNSAIHFALYLPLVK